MTLSSYRVSPSQALRITALLFFFMRLLIIIIFHLLLRLRLLLHFVCRNSNFSFDDEVCVDFVFQACNRHSTTTSTLILEHAACPWAKSPSRVEFPNSNSDCDALATWTTTGTGWQPDVDVSSSALLTSMGRLFAAWQKTDKRLGQLGLSGMGVKRGACSCTVSRKEFVPA